MKSLNRCSWTPSELFGARDGDPSPRERRRGTGHGEEVRVQQRQTEILHEIVHHEVPVGASPGGAVPPMADPANSSRRSCRPAGAFLLSAPEDDAHAELSIPKLVFSIVSDTPSCLNFPAIQRVRLGSRASIFFVSDSASSPAILARLELPGHNYPLSIPSHLHPSTVSASLRQAAAKIRNRSLGARLLALRRIMCALSSPAVHPSAGGVPRRAAAAPSDASERASGKKRPRVAPARDSSSACLTKTTRNNSVVIVTAAGEMSSSQELLLQKHLASELDALRGLLKKSELISRCGTCKAGAQTAGAGKKDRSLVSSQRPKLIEEDFNAPLVKRSKISTTLVVVESKNEKVAGESKDDKITEESKGEVVVRKQEEEEYADISGGLSFGSSGDSDTKVVQQSSEAKKKVQDAQQRARAAPKAVVVDMPGLLYRANLRRQQLEMERAVSRSIN